MYPSTSLSSSQGSMGPSSGGLLRCGSAPSSLLKNAVDSSSSSTTTTRDFSAAIGPQTTHHTLSPALFFPSPASESANREEHRRPNTAHQSAFGFPSSSSSSSSSLVRHSSSPAGFLNQLATAAGDNGFSITRGITNYDSKGIAGSSRGSISRLNSQLSFTRHEGLARISEETESESVDANASTDNGQRKNTHSYASDGFGMGSWDDGGNSNQTMFSVAQRKKAKHMSGGIISGIDESHEFQFGIPQGSLEMATMEKLLHIPQDSVPCKIRAKRGCATHPRSIAERERRTRISGKLKKLQDLVPNMDKQTSYADMLDLAVQHIKALQNQVQKLNKELEGCTCGCKKMGGEHK